MTKDEIIAMARQAGMSDAEYGPHCTPGMYAHNMEIIHRFAALVAAKEREAILRTVDEIEEPPYTGYENPNTFDDGCIAVADAIRARSTP